MAVTSTTGRILVYTTDGCRHCSRVLGALAVGVEEALQLQNPNQEGGGAFEGPFRGALGRGETGPPLVVVNLAKFPNRSDELFQLTKKKSVPQVFFNEDHVGGAAEVLQWVEDETLPARVAEVLAGPAPKFPVPPAAHADGENPPQGQEGTQAAPPPVVMPPADPHEERLVALDRLHADLRDPAQCPDFVKLLHSRRKKRMFKGKRLVPAIAALRQIPPSKARDLAGQLLRWGYVECLSKLPKERRNKPTAQLFREAGAADSLQFRFVCDEDRWVLNARRKFHARSAKGSGAKGALELAQELNKQCVLMADRYVTPGGTGVDYERLKGSAEFERYVRCAVELQTVDLSVLNENGRKALFINLYNMVVIHANVTRGPPKNALQRNQYFTRVCYNVGGEKFSLNAIEHGILRGNSKPLGIKPRTPFRKSDPRKAYVVKKDPRIHFVLVCGAKGCPPIKVLNARNLDLALDWATEGFCDSEVEVVPGKRKVVMSMLFRWYAVDFGRSTGDVLEWVAAKTSAEHPLRQLLQEHDPASIKVKYSDYDWSLNNDTPQPSEDTVHEPEHSADWTSTGETGETGETSATVGDESERTGESWRASQVIFASSDGDSTPSPSPTNARKRYKNRGSSKTESGGSKDESEDYTSATTTSAASSASSTEEASDDYGKSPPMSPKKGGKKHRGKRRSRNVETRPSLLSLRVPEEIDEHHPAEEKQESSPGQPQECPVHGVDHSRDYAARLQALASGVSNARVKKTASEGSVVMANLPAHNEKKDPEKDDVDSGSGSGGSGGSGGDGDASDRRPTRRIHVRYAPKGVESNRYWAFDLPEEASVEALRQALASTLKVSLDAVQSVATVTLDGSPDAKISSDADVAELKDQALLEVLPPSGKDAEPACDEFSCPIP